MVAPRWGGRDTCFLGDMNATLSSLAPERGSHSGILQLIIQFSISSCPLIVLTCTLVPYDSIPAPIL